MQQAEAVHKNVNGLLWPVANNKVLVSEFISADDAKKHIAAGGMKLTPTAAETQDRSAKRQALAAANSGASTSTASSLPAAKPAPLPRAPDAVVVERILSSGRKISIDPALKAALTSSSSWSSSEPFPSSSSSSSAAAKPEPAPAPVPPGKSLDELFLKTKAKPVLYYKPLTDAEIVEKKEREKARQERLEKEREER